MHWEKNFSKTMAGALLHPKFRVQEEIEGALKLMNFFKLLHSTPLLVFRLI